MAEEKIEVITHKKGWKTLLRCIIRADNLKDAIDVLREAYPDQDITEYDVIYHKLIHPPTQLQLF